MNIYISNGGERNTFLFINIKRKTINVRWYLWQLLSGWRCLGKAVKVVSQNCSSRLWNWSLWLIWRLTQFITDDCSQGDPAAQVHCWSMREAFEEVTLTFRSLSNHLLQETRKSVLLGKKRSWWLHFFFDDPHMLLISLCPPWEHFSSSLLKITNTPTSCLGSYGNLIPFLKVVQAGILTFGKMRFMVIFRLK